MSVQEYRSRNLRPQVSLHPQLPDLAVISVPPTAPLVPHSSQVVVDAPCGEAVLRGAHVFAPGVLACPVSTMSGTLPPMSNMSELPLCPDLQQGAPVSVYADITGLCRRGLTKTFDGPKLFVGNGRMVLSRAELFASNNPRYLCLSEHIIYGMRDK
ncbi:NSUN6 [Cordylochernes scorpioides]|uniref:NSUN6 n=1 Tax=Cordylochernes scorpioides TaxID=51811 RepID=A0ABY6LKM7_9ARAC|nr:NSUN6 [Cordylochernes scorpioides]